MKAASRLITTTLNVITYLFSKEAVFVALSSYSRTRSSRRETLSREGYYKHGYHDRQDSDPLSIRSLELHLEVTS